MRLEHLFVIFSLASVTLAATVPKKGPAAVCDPNTGIGCLPSPADCPEGCVCNRTDNAEVVTETVSEDTPSEKMEFIFKRTVVNYGSAGISDENDLGVEDRLATSLHEKVERVFRGIFVSAALFIACASICLFSVCLYCCHIRKTDRKLKEEVEALAKKLKIDVSKKPGPSRQQHDPLADSCNVVVPDANVMCV